MKHPSHNGKQGSQTGEVWVWFCSMGLSVGLLLIAALLLLIAVNGLRVFWPKPVAAMEIRTPSAAGTNFVRLGGIVHGSRRRMLRQSEDRTSENEWYIQLGNRERTGVSFRYVPFSSIVHMEYPADAIVLERTDYGVAIGVPQALQIAGKPVVEAEDPAFEKQLNLALNDIRKLRARLRRLEKDEIGRINAELENLRLRERKLLKSKSNESAGQILNDRRTALGQDYDVAAAEARRLRSELPKYGRLVLTDLAGSTMDLSVETLIDAHFPNRMSAHQKLVYFAQSLLRFLIEEPREANTEGGIFPAIFGTFVMTVLMSVAVMPFGLLAAIYLREYAQPGPFLRLVRISVNNLAGVPSIVFGVFGLGFFVYTVGGSVDRIFHAEALPTPTFGTGGILWASLTLALLTVPVVIVAAEEALAAVPRSMRDGSLALGASKWQTIYRVVLPAAAPGIITGLILAMARGAGEVAPLMLVGVVKMAPSLPVDGVFPFIHLDRKFMHLGFHIYDLGFQSPDSDAARPMVFATTLFLILLVVLLNLSAIVIRERLRRKYATSAF